MAFAAVAVRNSDWLQHQAALRAFNLFFTFSFNTQKKINTKITSTQNKYFNNGHKKQI